jgi:hypothetical protein
MLGPRADAALNSAAAGQRVFGVEDKLQIDRPDRLADGGAGGSHVGRRIKSRKAAT